MDMKEKIRPIYEELIGYLSQTPLAKEGTYFYESHFWTQLNNTVDELLKLEKNDYYSKFKVTVIQDGSEPHISVNEYRTKLNGLIMNLHAKHFKEESTPFGGQPSTVVNQTQSQSVQITMILDFQSFIDKKIYTEKLEEKEKNFLEKIKSSLATVKSIAELLNLIMVTAQNFNLDANSLQKIFKI